MGSHLIDEMKAAAAVTITIVVARLVVPEIFLQGFLLPTQIQIQLISAKARVGWGAERRK